MAIRAATAFFFFTVLTFPQFGDSIRCYECRSDKLPACGDPFYSGGVPAVECDNFFTQSTFMCYKANHFVAGQYITVRGCAPFTTEMFPPALQRAMSGSYWKSFQWNSFSLCDYNACNSSSRTGGIWTFAIMVPLLVSLLSRDH